MTLRTIAAIIAPLAFAPGATGAGSNAASDIRNLVEELEQRHPNPYHAISSAEFRGAAEDLATRAPGPTGSEQIVGVMHLMHLLGERDGHSGVVLIGRRTFSAAGSFAADVDRMTRARFFGEPTGGAPSQWGDRSPIPLPALGIESGTATEYVGDPQDTRVATMPQVPVEMTAADCFAGRDPVLAAALR